MKAVFITGGKQYYVAEGDEIFVEKIEAEDGSLIDFTEVLSVGDKTGLPYVKDAKVTCEVVKTGKKKKIVVFKYKAKKNYKRKQGHRQPYTKLIVKKITG